MPFLWQGPLNSGLSNHPPVCLSVSNTFFLESAHYFLQILYMKLGTRGVQKWQIQFFGGIFFFPKTGKIDHERAKNRVFQSSWDILSLQKKHITIFCFPVQTTYMRKLQFISYRRKCSLLIRLQVSLMISITVGLKWHLRFFIW